jgi:hypothetical protein
VVGITPRLGYDTLSVCNLTLASRIVVVLRSAIMVRPYRYDTTGRVNAVVDAALLNLDLLYEYYLVVLRSLSGVKDFLVSIVPSHQSHYVDITNDIQE